MAKLGQHFLTDLQAQADIVRAAGVGENDAVLEIGPGRGALTAPLLATGARVVAVETDLELADSLPGRLGNPPRLTVIGEDFLRLNPATLGAGPWFIVANLPYAVGTAILQKILLWDGWQTATLMFQKEVALRIVADVGGADYGLLSLSVRLRADADIILDLSPESFRPRPQVESAVVQLRRLPKPRLGEADEAMFWRLAKAAFGQRRKMAANVIAKVFNVPRIEVEAAFSGAGLDVAVRPEQIPFEAWLALAGEFNRNARKS